MGPPEPTAPAPRRPLRAELALLAVLALSLALRLWPVTWGIGLHWWDQWHHPDEPLITDYTRDFPGSFLTYDNYRYPVGYHHVVVVFNAFCRLAQAIVDGTPLTFPALSADQWETLFTRLFTVLLGVATVLFVYLATAQLTRCRRTALAAAFALNLLPLHVLNSAVATTDIPMALVTLWAVMLYQRRRAEGRLGSWTTALALGALLGVAFAVKYSAFFLLGSLGLLMLWHVAVRQRRPGTFVGGQVLILTVCCFVFALLVPGLFFHLGQIAGGFRFETWRVYRLGHGPLDAARAVIDCWGWAGTALVAISLVPAWRANRQATAEILLFMAIFFLVSMRGIISRYVLWITPLAAVLIGLGVHGLLTAPGRGRTALRWAMSVAAAAALAVTLVCLQARFWWDSRVRTAFHIVETYPPGTTVGNDLIGHYQRGQPYIKVDLPPEYPSVNAFDGPDLLILAEHYLWRVREYWAHPELLRVEDMAWWDERELATPEELAFLRDVVEGRSEYRLVATFEPPPLPVEFAGSTYQLYEREGPPIPRPNSPPAQPSPE